MRYSLHFEVFHACRADRKNTVSKQLGLFNRVSCTTKKPSDRGVRTQVSQGSGCFHLLPNLLERWANFGGANVCHLRG